MPVVEDEDRLRDLVVQFLKSVGYSVVEATDGAEGVDRFRESGPFDLALVDLNLPVFSGVEVCRRIKAINPAQKLLICSGAILGDHETALAAVGVDHFLTKPYHPLELLDHIASELSQAECDPLPIG
ncbi:MAG: response regulator [Isosphaeraceae bacterium]